MRTLLDRLAARVGIWALKRLFGTCPPDDYEPECLSCLAGRLINVMEDL